MRQFPATQYFGRRTHRTGLVALGIWSLALALGMFLPACEVTDRTDPTVVVTDPDYRVPLGGTYEERGAIATDREDGVLDTADIVTDNSAVRTDSVGTYPVLYFTMDAAGNEDSATRMLDVYVRPIHYAGTWSVVDTCDSVGMAYPVTFDFFPGDSTTVSVANFRNRGSSYIVDMTVRGILGRVIELSDTVEALTFVGTSLLTEGTLDRFAFDLSFDESDTIGTVIGCEAEFRRP